MEMPPPMLPPSLLLPLPREIDVQPEGKMDQVPAWISWGPETLKCI